MARHILILNERDLDHPRAGGAEIHLFEIFGRLVQAGDRVTMLCAGFPGGAPETTIAGVGVRRLGSSPYAYYARIISAARQYIAGERPDVLVEAHNKLPFLSPLYTRIRRLVIVHHLFGTTAFQQVAPPVAAAVLGAERLIPYLYRGVPFVAISESSRRDMLQRGLAPDAVRVVLCGVDHNRYHVGDAPRPEQPLAVFVGRIETYKRLDVLLHAFREVCGRGLDARLAILGTGDALPRVRALVGELGLTARVAIPGFVDEDEKVRMLQQAHVVVQPSDKEGWGLTVIEANACGTPVIAADAPGLRDSVRDEETGLLVPPGDASALAGAMLRILGDAALRARLAEAAIAWAARFRWEDAAAQIGEALDDACGHSGGARQTLPATDLSLSIRAPEKN
jgi:glycosyltransferase involved in cell wall biosynthesis